MKVSALLWLQKRSEQQRDAATEGSICKMCMILFITNQTRYLPPSCGGAHVAYIDHLP